MTEICTDSQYSFILSYSKDSVTVWIIYPSRRRYASVDSSLCDGLASNAGKRVQIRRTCEWRGVHALHEQPSMYSFSWTYRASASMCLRSRTCSVRSFPYPAQGRRCQDLKWTHCNILHILCTVHVQIMLPDYLRIIQDCPKYLRRGIWRYDPNA